MVYKGGHYDLADVIDSDAIGWVDILDGVCDTQDDAYALRFVVVNT